MVKKIIIVIAIIVALFALLWYIGFFNIKGIDVEGTGYQKNDIIEWSGIESDENIFLLSSSNMITNLKENPRIDKVTVAKNYFSQRVSITYTVKEPLVIVSAWGYYGLLDENGYVLEVKKDLSIDNTMILSGISVVDMKLGEKITVLDEDRLAFGLEIAKGAKEGQVTPSLSEIRLFDEGYGVLYTTYGIKAVLRESNDIHYKMDLLYSILLEVQKDGTNSGTIDLRFDGNPVYAPNDDLVLSLIAGESVKAVQNKPLDFVEPPEEIPPEEDPSEEGDTIGEEDPNNLEDGDDSSMDQSLPITREEAEKGP